MNPALDTESLPKAIAALRAEVLFSDATEALCPMAEQYWLLALSSLEQAERFAKLAEYAQAQAIAAR